MKEQLQQIQAVAIVTFLCVLISVHSDEDYGKWFVVEGIRQDITYDVNFSLLKLVAEKFGFKESYYSSQTNFFLNNKFILNQISDINLKNIKKLIDPHQMGERFKFISFLKKKKPDI